MKKIRLREILAPAATLFSICAIVTAALALTNSATMEPIARINAQAEAAARQEVLPAAVTFEERPLEGQPTAPCLGKDQAGLPAGWVIVTQAKGYGGTVKVMTGIDLAGTVTGVTILSHEETVGLGANATKEAFRDQYCQPVPEEGFSVFKAGQPGGEGKIAAMTGATITSNAVTDAVNEAIAIFRQLTAEGGN